MTTKPILFNGEMVEALLEGRKTQTRRIIKSNHESGLFSVSRNPQGKVTSIDSLDWEEQQLNETNDIKPKYKVGDILWVRETVKVGAFDFEERKLAFDYKASPELKKTPWCSIENREWFAFEKARIEEELHVQGFESTDDYHQWAPGESPLRWKPSIHMPKAACRIFLKVTDVRVERLQDISSEDAKAEGIKYAISGAGFCGYDHLSGGYNLMTTSRKSFFSLWRKIQGLGIYDELPNPWVWVYEFKRVEKPKNII